MSIETVLCWGPRTRTVTLLLVLLLVFTAGCSDKQSPPSQQDQPQDTPPAQVEEPAPAPPAEEPMPEDQPLDAPPDQVEEPEPAAPEETVTMAVNGEEVYQKACKLCHDAGVANAPKLGDKDAWAPRIAKGNDALFASSKNGLNAMPPKGGCMTCTDEEIRSAIEYLVEQGS